MMAYVAIDGIIFNIALRQKVRNEMDSRSHLFSSSFHRRREGGREGGRQRADN